MQAYNWILSKITLLWSKLAVTSPLGMTYQNLILGFVCVSIFYFFMLQLVKGVSGQIGIKTKKGSDRITKVQTETIYYRSGKNGKRNGAGKYK